MPFKLSDPQATIGSLEMKCHGRRIVLTDVENTDGATFCEPDGSTYSFGMEVYQSFGASGLEANLRPLVGTIVEVLVESKDGTVSEEFPQWKFDWKVPNFPVIDAGISEFTAFTRSRDIEEGTLQKSIDGTTWTAMP